VEIKQLEVRKTRVAMSHRQCHAALDECDGVRSKPVTALWWHVTLTES